MTPTDESLELTVRLFAGAAEAVGQRSIELSIPRGAELASVVDALLQRQPQLAPLVRVSRWAVGNEFISEDYKFSEKTGEVAMIPPVSGG